MDIKARRTALGWSRKDLAARAKVDASVLQLLELGLSEDSESRKRCEDALAIAEGLLSNGTSPKTDPGSTTDA